MKRKVYLTILILIVAGVSFSQTNELTYQGRLVAGESAANTPHDFEFRLCDSDKDCTTPLEIKQRPGTPVSNGTFTVKLDFNTLHFNGADRWLEIAVRPAGAGTFVTLSPRQRVTSAPYSIKSLKSDSATNASQLDGMDASQYVLTTDARMSDARDPRPNSPNYIRNSVEPQTGNFNISDHGVIGKTLSVDTNTLYVDAAADRVGIGTVTPSTTLQVVGTVNFTGFRTEGGPEVVSVIGGHSSNALYLSGYGGVIGGGGTSESPNVVSDPYGTIAGGVGNTAGDLGPSLKSYAAVGGGLSNNAGGFASVVAGGERNRALGNDSTVSGGSENRASAAFSSISGGSFNLALGLYSSIAGGRFNTTAGEYSAIGGGLNNTASGAGSTIPGGDGNTADGDFSFAAGRGAGAGHKGSFVWSDGTVPSPGLFSSTGQNQFLINAQGGVGIGTNAPGGRLHVNGTGIVRALVDSNDNAGFGLRLNNVPKWSLATVVGGQFQIFNDATGQNAFWIDSTTNNVGVGTSAPAYKLDVNGTIRGTNVAPSDFRFKQDIRPLTSPLDKIRLLRGVSYHWRATEFPGMNFSLGRSIGFIAQEVDRVLPELVSRDDKGFLSLAYSEMLPVVVEAVKEQQKQIESQAASIAQQKALIERQQQQIDSLKKLVCLSNAGAEICKPEK